MDTMPIGPMTRSRVKALHGKVTSLLSMCDLDLPLNGLLLHAGTLCILRIQPDDDPQWSREEVQDDGEGDQEKTPKDGQREEEGGEDCQTGLQAGLGWPPGRHPSSASRPPRRPRPVPRPASILSQPAPRPVTLLRPPASQPAWAGPQAGAPPAPAAAPCACRPPGRPRPAPRPATRLNPPASRPAPRPVPHLSGQICTKTINSFPLSPF